MSFHTFYFDSSENNAAIDMYSRLKIMIEEEFDISNGIVLFCIGTDRITGDSLGPLVGYKLEKMRLNNLYIYGTLDKPVHALNLERMWRQVNKLYPNSPVIAIDASLGSSSHLGCMTVSRNSLKPGLGVKKSLRRVGDISITGIVCASSPLANLQLQTTRLATVMTLADCIADSIYMLSFELCDVAASLSN